MFWFGVLVGAAAAAWFILYGDGDLLIRLAESTKRTADRFREWRAQQGTGGSPKP